VTDLTVPDWIADAVFYQIFPERFANGDHRLDPPDVVPWDAEPTRDNFFGGDLAGITARLDHIESVGANAIYLTPIFEADTNHRYDAKDYFSIDHRLGDLDAFRAFLDAAHGRGIRVVLDAVLNHCGDGHWAFRDVVENEAESRYVNWFSVEGFPVTAHPEPNYRTCSGCYYLPKWNAYNPEVRAHHFDVARYWIDQGIDGWRLDVPYFINRTFWREFRTVVKERGENLYVVAEEWRDPEEWLQGDLADGTMNYTLRDLVLGFTADRTVDAYAFADGMNRLRDRIPAAARPAMLNLLGSHDTERVLTRHRGDVSAALRAYALLFAAQGSPMVYYGDEVGMQGENDPGCRGAMVWDEDRWNSELLTSIREWTSRRAGSLALRRGDQDVVAIDADAVAVIRSSGGESVAVVVNRGAEPVTWTGWDEPARVPPGGTVVLAKGAAA
jgi:glycosidase